MNSKYPNWYFIVGLFVSLLGLYLLDIIAKNIMAIGVVISIVVLVYTRFVNQYGDKKY